MNTTRKLHIMERKTKKTLLKNLALKGLLTILKKPFLSILYVLLVVSIPVGHASKKSKNKLNIEVGKGIILRLKAPAASVFIANPTIADIQVKSPTLVYILGKKQGETNIYALAKNDVMIYEGSIAVNQNLGGLNAALKSVLPKASINVQSYEGLLVLTGHVKNPTQAEVAAKMAKEFIGSDSTIINKINIASPLQVNLRVRIAEVGRDTMKQLGVNWQNIFTSGSAAVGLFTGTPVFTGAALASNGLTPINKAFLGGNRGINNISSTFKLGNLDMNVILDAMEKEGVLSILAEPNLTALSGEEASFLAGGEYPIPMFEDNKVVITFKQFGVALKFKPTVLETGLINLHIAPEVSQLSTNGSVSINGFTVPAVTTRKVETTVELGSGQSFAIAGLLQNDTTNDVTKFPFLGDLPIIGALFRSSKYRLRETELVIIVTPYIVKPHNAGSMPLPTDNLRIASDLERNLYGKSFEERKKPSPQAIVMKNKGKRKTTTGFMLD